jgi:hypothetical protein
MAWDKRKRGLSQFAFDDMKIRPADPTDSQANQHFSGAWIRYWKLAKL